MKTSPRENHVVIQPHRFGSSVNSEAFLELQVAANNFEIHLLVDLSNFREWQKPKEKRKPRIPRIPRTRRAIFEHGWITYIKLPHISRANLHSPRVRMSKSTAMNPPQLLVILTQRMATQDILNKSALGIRRRPKSH